MQSEKRKIMLLQTIEEGIMARSKQPGLDDRARNENGATRAKNGNTQVGTLRKTYGAGFAPGIRSDTHLRTVLDRAGAGSLSEYIKQGR